MKEAIAAGSVGCGLVLFFFAVWFAISAGLGWLAAWVLSYFGVHVPWYVCSVALFIIGTLFGKFNVKS